MAFAVRFASACGRKPVTAAAPRPCYGRILVPAYAMAVEAALSGEVMEIHEPTARRVGLRDQDLPALFKSSNTNGSERSRLQVAAKIAFETAGAMGGTPGSPRRLVRFSDMKVHGWHIRQAQWLISIEIGLIDYTIGQCVGAGIDLRLYLFAASPTERGGTSPKFQHSSGADVSPVLSSARACRADSDPVRTHDGATHAVANRSAIELTKRRGFFAGARSRRAGRAPS